MLEIACPFFFLNLQTKNISKNKIIRESSAVTTPYLRNKVVEQGIKRR